MSIRKTDSASDSSPRAHDFKNPYGVEGVIETEAGTVTVDQAWVTDHHAERALCRKFDFRLLPCLAVMYLFNALDKGNLGNAKTDGMEHDLHFVGNQYVRPKLEARMKLR